MELKLKSGRRLKVKDISLDERNTLLDSVKYNFDENGKFKDMQVPNSTICLWLRTCVTECTVGKSKEFKELNDDILWGFSIEDNYDAFIQLQTKYMSGEGKASK